VINDDLADIIHIVIRQVEVQWQANQTIRETIAVRQWTPIMALFEVGAVV
jgi:hypothetical protein